MVPGSSIGLAHQKGTTLVELLVSILILSLGIIGTIALLPQAYKGITRAGRVSTINHLGYQKIDELRTLASTNWNHADLTDGGHPATAAERVVGGDFPDYSITWTLEDSDPAFAAETGDIKTVIVEVGYLVHNSAGNVVSPAHKEAISKKFQTFIAD